KLKGLHAEIASKLHSYALSDEDNKEAIEKLNSVAQEINKAINGIDTLVNLVNNPEDANQASLRDPLRMAEFKQDLVVNLEKITKIQEQI
ncbi:MAG: hypothetical protein PSV35_08780, partial [bacterium]|nr:hypothetical protein [bacterium]